MRNFRRADVHSADFQRAGMWLNSHIFRSIVTAGVTVFLNGLAAAKNLYNMFTIGRTSRFRPYENGKVQIGRVEMSRITKFGASCAALAVAMVSVPAFSQTAAPAEAESDYTDIIVTANKREQRLQDTPTSIGVISSEALASRQVTDVQEITRNVAGLNVVNAGPGQNTLMIRGLVGAGESTVGLYYDNMPTAGMGESAALAGGRQTDFLVYDAQRVEVLRGPQSTLYGSSALAGVVRILSNPARLGEFEGRIDLDGSTVSHGEEGYSVKGMINVPLGDQVAMRFVGYGIRTPGFVDQARYGIKDFNSATTWGFRWNTLFELSERTSVTTQLYVQDLKSNGPSFTRPRASVIGGVTLPGAGEYSTNAQTLESYDDRSILASLNFEHRFDNMTLSFIQSYQKRRNISFTDEQGLPYFFGFLQSIGAFPNITLPQAITFRSEQDLKMWNSELRLASNFDGPFNFVVGGIYQDRTVSIDNSFVDLDQATGDVLYSRPSWYHRAADFQLKQLAAFGEATLKVTDQFSLLAGARVFQNKRHDIARSIVPFLRLGTPGAPDDVRSKESKAIYRFEADFKPSDNVMFYASASQGYRAGGTIVRVIPELPASYGPDYTWNFELGAKTDWLDHALQANVAVYQINWYDTQIAGEFFNGSFEGILNCEGLCARSRGVEVDLTARPVRGLELTASGTVFKAKWLKAQPAMNGAPAAGTQFTNTPTFTLNGSASYRWEIGGGKEIEIRADAQHRGKYAFVDYRPLYNQYRPEAFTLVNAAITLSNADKWNVSLYGRNLFDKRAVLTTAGDNVQFDQELIAQPRTFGVQLGYSF